MITRSSIGFEVSKSPKVKKSAKLGSGERFKALTKGLRAKGVEDPAALAASIGRKKYGSAKMSQMSTTGKRQAK